VTGKTVLCAEGYLLALARKGYISHGVWVPEFILEQPEVLRNVHHEFTHAGTDITKAFQVSCATSFIFVQQCYKFQSNVATTACLIYSMKINL